MPLMWLVNYTANNSSLLQAPGPVIAALIHFLAWRHQSFWNMVLFLLDLCCVFVNSFPLWLFMFLCCCWLSFCLVLLVSAKCLVEKAATGRVIGWKDCLQCDL